MPYRKNQYNVTVPHSSGFDKSHRYSGTGMCGTLIPVLCDEVIPGTKVRLRVPMSAQLPPLASETFMNASIKYEAFFVPTRLLCKSFESFFNDFPERVQYNPETTSPSSGSWYDLKGLLPVFSLPLTGSGFGPGSLMDYLGFCSQPSPSTPSMSVRFSPLPLIAYHLIWQEWYRNPRVQNPAFSKTLGSTDNTNALRASTLTDTFFFDGYPGIFSPNYVFSLSADYSLSDGVSIFALRQRNFGLDYFTGARTSAQQGDASSVSIAIPAGTDSAGGVTTMTIAALRAANSLQQFRERNNLASPRFVDQIQDRYGVRPSDGVAQRPICIGTSTVDISTRGVDQTAADNVGGSTSNPFSSVAAQYGRGGALSNDYLIENFEVLEPGFIMVMQSLVPEVTYTVGVEKHFQRYLGPGSIVDMANPLLQNVGDQPIYSRELTGYGTAYPNQIFGYTDRFAEFMFRKNSVHGAMRADAGSYGSLKSFILQRDLTGQNVTLSTNFLEIPTNYLDQVFAVSSEAAGLSYWFDLYFDYKITMPLAEYSIPSLQDPAYEHGKHISIRRNGQIF